MNDKSRIDRREFLRLAGIAGIVLAGTAAGCQTQAQPSTSSTAPTASAASTAPQRGGTLVIGMSGEAAELDPHVITSGPSRTWQRPIYNTLVNFSVDGNIIPELAVSWSNPDPNTYEFKLRNGVKFHDGTDFNAEAVKFNVERMMDTPYGKSLFANVISVKLVDDYTVRFNLKTPQSSLLSQFGNIRSSGMVSPTAVKKLGDKASTAPVGMGTGPFEFVEWVRGDHMTVKRFDGYWRKDEYGDPLPYLDQVIMKPIPDQSVLLTNLRTGNIDLMIQVLEAQVPLVEKDENLKLTRWGTASNSIYLNNGRPPFNNKALRQAVVWAVDLESLNKAIYGGIGEPARYTLPPSSWGFDPTGKFYTRNVVKAKEKLAEGGKPQGFKFEGICVDGAFELRLMQAIKSQVAEVGIDMEILPVEQSQLLLLGREGKFDGRLAPSGFLGPDDLYQYFHTKGAVNANMKYSNPEVDKLLEQAETIYNQAERKAVHAKIQALVLDDCPFVWIHHGLEASAMAKKVMGFTPTIDAYHFPVDWYWLKK